MRCIEIELRAKTGLPQSKINRNMRCIEMKMMCFGLGLDMRLIETWDVLK